MLGKKICRLVLLFLMIAPLVVGNGQIVSAEEPKPDFELLSNELVQMEHLYQITTGGQSIVFNSEAAKGMGFSTQSIKLAEETAAFTNEVVAKAIAQAKAAGVGKVDLINIEGVTVDMSKYPTLAVYNAEASQRVAVGITLRTVNPQSAPSVCGSIGNPVPRSPQVPQQWVRQGPYNTKTDAENKLKSWGYYRAWIPGGNWTRNQTYQQSTCKKNTYRDESSLPAKASNGKWYFNEQNYTSPIPGEPNPVMSAWPGNWPYATWPAYVFWWHQFYTCRNWPNCD